MGVRGGLPPPVAARRVPVRSGPGVPPGTGGWGRAQVVCRRGDGLPPRRRTGPRRGRSVRRRGRRKRGLRDCSARVPSVARRTRRRTAASVAYPFVRTPSRPAARPPEGAGLRASHVPLPHPSHRPAAAPHGRPRPSHAFQAPDVPPGQGRFRRSSVPNCPAFLAVGTGGHAGWDRARREDPLTASGAQISQQPHGSSSCVTIVHV